MDVLWLTLPGHTDVLTMTCCLFECADSQSEWFSSGASAGLEKHGSLLWRLNTGLLLRLNLFICHPTMHWDRRGRWGCLEEQQQGSFSQMDMCLLWDVSSSVTVMRTTSKKKIGRFLLGPLFSKQSKSASIIRQIFQISSECLGTEWSSGYWLTRYY